jgi:hypothetical protein
MASHSEDVQVMSVALTFPDTYLPSLLSGAVRTGYRIKT